MRTIANHIAGVRIWSDSIEDCSNVAIGPEADRQVSGRVVVIAAAFVGVGGMSLVFGAGPIVKETDALTVIAGAVTMAAGGVMVIGGIGLLSRGSGGRALGIAGAGGAILLSLVLVAAALASFGGCQSVSEGGASCEPVVVAVACLGLVVGALAFAATRVIRAVPNRYWHRRGR